MKSSWYQIAQDGKLCRACLVPRKLAVDTISLHSHQDQSHWAPSNRTHVHEQPNCAVVSRRTDSSLSKPLRRALLAPHFANGLVRLTKRLMSKNLQSDIRPPFMTGSNGQLGARPVPAKNPRQSNGTVAVITTQQLGSEVRMLIRSERQSNATYRSPRQSATSVRSVSHASKREKLVEVDEENSKSRREYERRDGLRR